MYIAHSILQTSTFCCTHACRVRQNQYIIKYNIIKTVRVFWPNVRVSPRNFRALPLPDRSRGWKRWTPFINVFGHHMLRALRCVVIPSASIIYCCSSGDHMGRILYVGTTRGLFPRNSNAYVRHMVHDIRCMNACASSNLLCIIYVLYYIPLERKKIVYQLDVIVFHVSIDPVRVLLH